MYSSHNSLHCCSVARNPQVSKINHGYLIHSCPDKAFLGTDIHLFIYKLSLQLHFPLKLINRHKVQFSIYLILATADGADLSSVFLDQIVKVQHSLSKFSFSFKYYNLT